MKYVENFYNKPQSKYDIIAMLRSYVPNDILVYMNNIELSTKVANKINQYANYREVNIQDSDGTDPEEYLKKKLLREIEIL